MINPTEPFPNIPLLRKAVEWAEAEAAKTADECEWDQDWFAQPAACGTSHCIAGWAVVQAIPQARVVVDSASRFYGLEIDGQSADWWNTATELLGITERESGDLFCPGTDIAEIREIAEGIAARAGDRL